MELLKKKTTWAGISMIVTAIGSYITGTAEPIQAIQAAIAGFGLIFMREAIHTK